MADENPGLFTLTTPVILAHPGLFEARKFGAKGKEVGEAKFSASFVFSPDHPDYKTMKSIAAAVAKAKFPGRELKTLHFPFLNGSTLADKRKAKGKDDGEFQRGMVVMPARSKFPPQLAVLENKRIVELTTEAARANARSKFYFGVECLAQFNFVAYEPSGGGVTAYLNQVLSLNKGEKLSSAPSAAETFKGYVGTVSQDDPTAGETVDDEIPF